MLTPPFHQAFLRLHISGTTYGSINIETIFFILCYNSALVTAQVWLLGACRPSRFRAQSTRAKKKLSSNCQNMPSVDDGG